MEATNLLEHQRVLLNSLEVEAGLDYPTTELSILAQGLFSAQICLIDQHIVDNRHVKDFFLENERGLLNMMDSLQPWELPLIGTCGRGGPDAVRSLDVMLRPRDGKPLRLSSLSPSASEKLAVGYNKMSEEERRNSFLATKGESGKQEYEKYLEVATKYFSRAESLTVLHPTRPTDEALYREMEVLLRFLHSEFPEEFKDKDEDEKIYENLLEEVTTAKNGRTRERLHRLIYGEHFPPYFEGVVAWSAVRQPVDRFKDQWRFLVNDVYNRNLAFSFGLDSGQNLRTNEIRFENIFRERVQPEKAGLTKLACQIYAQFLSFEFVRNVRKQKQFWQNLSNPYLDPATHCQFIAEEFAKHLIDQGQGKLVGTTKREKLVVPMKTIRLVGPPIVAALVFFHQLKGGSTLVAALEARAAYKGTDVVLNPICRGVEDFFSTLGAGIGNRRVYDPRFTNFLETLGSTTKTQRPADTEIKTPK